MDNNEWFALLRKGSVNEIEAALAVSPELARALEDGGMPALFVAVMRDEIAVIDALIARGAPTGSWTLHVPIDSSVPPPGTPSAPPLYAMTFARSRAACEALMRGGEDVRRASLSSALKTDDLFATWLLDHNVAVDDEALLIASVCDILVDRCAATADEAVRQRALQRAGLDGEVTAMRRLVATGIVPRNPEILALAASNNDIEAANIVLDAGADPNARTANGGAAIIDAAYGGALACVRPLLARGADATVRNASGQSALDGARAAGDTVMIALLERPGG